MASVYDLFPDKHVLFENLEEARNYADLQNCNLTRSAIVLQRFIRGYLVRKYIKHLNRAATKIQSTFRRHQAGKAYRRALYKMLLQKHLKYYCENAKKIQAAWRGYVSRKKNFHYHKYKQWLRTVAENGRRLAAEAAEYGLRSRIDNFNLLEDDARQWLALIVFKLHHLLRTYQISGIYSTPNSNELSEFEELLKSIRYTEYMNKLKEKYDEYVRKRKPMFKNKRLFPVIGDASEYWYLTLPEIYKLTAIRTIPKNTRHVTLHHGPMHRKPFLWKKIEKPKPEEGRGPFMVTEGDCKCQSGDAVPKDPRFHLYVEHYAPQPNLLKYVDMQINAIVTRSVSIGNLNKY